MYHFIFWVKEYAEQEAQLWLYACFLLNFLFDPEDRGDMFLHNTGQLSLDYTALYLRRQNSSRTMYIT
jgi:hypothetical protein